MLYIHYITLHTLASGETNIVGKVMFSTGLRHRWGVAEVKVEPPLDSRDGGVLVEDSPGLVDMVQFTISNTVCIIKNCVVQREKSFQCGVL